MSLLIDIPEHELLVEHLYFSREYFVIGYAHCSRNYVCCLTPNLWLACPYCELIEMKYRLFAWMNRNGLMKTKIGCIMQLKDLTLILWFKEKLPYYIIKAEIFCRKLSGLFDKLFL